MKHFQSHFEPLMQKGWFHIVVILLVCFFAFALPIQLLGLPSGFDMATVMRFAAAFQDAFANGQLLPSWANDNFGYGSVGIRFYPPLPMFLLAVTQTVTSDWFTTFLVNMYLWMVVGSIGMYLFAKEWGTPLQGLLAAILYTLVPQHLGEIFQFFMFAEFAAWATLPFCFLYLTRICRGGMSKDSVLFAVAYSVLILTHIPTTVIVSLCFPIYVVFALDWHNFKRVFALLATSLALVLLATAFRWVMLVNEVSWLAHNGPDHYNSGYYEFSQWLFPNVLASRSMMLYVMTSWLFDIAIVLTAVLSVPAIILLVRRIYILKSDVGRILTASLFTFLFSFFMLSRLSFYVWDNITFLQKIQFPWRWLSVLSFFCVVLFSLSIPVLASTFHKYSRLVAYPALALVVAIILFDITQIIIPSAPYPTAEFAKIQEDLRSEQIWKGWWPTWAKEEAFQQTVQVVAGSRQFEILSWQLESKSFVIKPGEPTNVRLGIFYYPLWKATVNDVPAEIGYDEYGALTVPVSAELSRVRLSFEEPVINKIAHVVSAITWLFPIFGLIFVYARKLVSSIKRRPLLQEEFDY